MTFHISRSNFTIPIIKFTDYSLYKRYRITRNSNLFVSLLIVVLLVSDISSVNSQYCEAPKSKTQPKSTASTILPPPQQQASTMDYKTAKSIYDFTVKDTHGNDVSLDKYEGFVVLVVNTASQCGLTKNNYAKLTELKNKYYERGLRILSFPCNQFGSQAPEADGEDMVCHLKSQNADIGDVFAKVNVNGDNADPLWKYLKHKQTGTLGSGIKWNFTKFLVDKQGQPVDRFAPTTDPMDISKAIEKLL